MTVLLRVLFLICYLKLGCFFLFFFLCVCFLCAFVSLFNIINTVSYIEIINVFNDFSNYSQYVPAKHNKILSPVTIKKNISIFSSSIIPHLESGVTSFKGYVNDILRRRYEKVKNGHICENWKPIWGLDVDLRLNVDLSLTYLINHVSASESYGSFIM